MTKSRAGRQICKSNPAFNKSLIAVLLYGELTAHNALSSLLIRAEYSMLNPKCGYPQIEHSTSYTIFSTPTDDR